jgi:lipoprotein-anchoring transpeptidase ErfK/SrfK
LAPAVAPVRETRKREIAGYALIAVVICYVLSLGIAAGVAAAAISLDIPEPLPTRALVFAASRATPEPTATIAVATQPTEVEKLGSTVAAQCLGGKSLSSSPVSLLTQVRSTRLSAPQPMTTGQIRDSGRHTSRPLTLPESSADLTGDHEPPATLPAPTATDSDPATATPFPTARIGGSFRWIDVDLTQQVLVAYEGETAVRSVIVSTGLPRTPTVTGRFKIYVKYRAADMSGPGYYLAKVPYIMYFYRGYGLHGTYWHSNFGRPMSHGCVNLPTPEAEWLFQWANVGTPVNIHY